jgi:hypothetical protein
VVGFFLIIAVAYLFPTDPEEASIVLPSAAVDENGTDVPEATIMNTEAIVIPTGSDQERIVTAQHVLDGAFDDLPGVVEVVGATANEFEPGVYFVYIEVTVSEGMVTQEMARTLFDRSIEMLNGVVAPFAVLLNDGELAIAFDWDVRANDWRETVMSITPTVTMAPTRVVPTNPPPPPPAPAAPRPGNCSTAVAMGLSAVEAAQWDHLDRDNDGVACYGD